MSDNTIEILGQKFSYPTTWQGTSSVLIICLCVSFLGYTLDAKQIDSYSNLLNGTTERAFNESLETIAKLNSDIEGMQSTINQLTEKANLADEEKQEVYSKLEAERQSREKALVNLNNLQSARVSELNTAYQNLSPQQQQQQQQIWSMQGQQIQQQLGNVQQQQQQQLKVTQ